VPLEQPGEYVIIGIHDDGHGIPEDVRDQIFEPFVTTKSRDNGTGLGLATSYGIVASADGHIWFETSNDSGTTFFVALPTSEAEHTEPTKPDRKGRRAKILVIDDDAKIRSLITRLLRQMNINAFSTESGEGARDLWAEHGGFDMLIADIFLPNTNGIELANDLLSSSTQAIPVLFLSGYTGEGVNERDVKSSHVRFFKKPFTPETLRDSVETMLGIDDDAPPE
jgi:CheY-like chemotaxis protein